MPGDESMSVKEREVYRIHAEICQALTHPVRLEIIDHLRTGEKTVGELVREMEMPQSTISRHLRLMRERGVVRARREGANVYYALSNEKIVGAYDLIHQFVVDHYNEQLSVFASTAP
jgi:ArsR family transcriptional regulator